MTRAATLTALFAVLTVVMAYPFSVHPGSRLLVNNTDTHLFLWTLAWEAHALVTQPWALFDGNFYYPYTNVLAWSENVLGSGLMAAPIIWLTGNAVLGLNVVSLASAALCGLGAWLLARRVGVSPYGAVIAGIIFAFSPARFFRMSQLHLTTVQWVPFSLAFLHGYLDTGRRRDLWLAVGFFTLQALTSGHGAVFLSLAIVALLVYRAALGEALAPVRRRRDFGVIGALLLAPTLWAFWHYRQVQVTMGMTRALEPGAWFPAFDSFFASPTHFHMFLQRWMMGRSPNEAADAYLFPGILPIVLAAAALVLPAVRFRSDVPGVEQPDAAGWRGRFRTSPVGFYGLLAAASLWVFLRPPYGVWPYVYWLPGLNLIRMPSRFMILTLLALAVLAGVGFDRLFARVRSSQWMAATVCAGVLLLGEFAAQPFSGTPYAIDIPAVDRWLATQPADLVFAEVPVPRSQDYGAFERTQTSAMLHSTAHWRRTVMGYTSIRPREHWRLFEALNRFPDAASLATLQTIGVTHIVVHTEEYAYEGKDWTRIEPRFAEFGLRLLHADGTGRVYALPAQR